MTRINASIPRTTSLLLSDQLLSALRQTQGAMLKAQGQISTGKAVNRASDAPAKTSAILLLQGAQEARQQHDNNLSFAQSTLDNVDQAMGDIYDLALEAKGVGSSQIGIGSTPDTRRNQAAVIDAQLQSLIDMANRQSQGVALFGGTAPGVGGISQPVFQYLDQLGGVRYLGTRGNLQTDVGLEQPLDVNLNGAEAFAALSARVRGDVDLDPQASGVTPLTDLAGALGLGVRKGVIRLNITDNSIPSTTSVQVDLTTADSVADVVRRIQSGLDTVPGAGSIAAGGAGLSVSAGATFTVQIADLPQGTTVADLGIALSVTAGTQAGADLGARLTGRTRLADLGVGVDLGAGGGLKITQGAITKVADFSACQTVQDMANVVAGLGLGVRLEVNDAGTGLDLVSEVSGPALSVGEVSGHRTATDLGLRSFAASTQLSDLNFGLGIHRTVGQDDFAIHLHDGGFGPIPVNLDGATTVGDVIDRIRAAAEAVLGAGQVGLPGQAGTRLNVGLASDGNGIVLEDGTTGADGFHIEQLGTSLAATDLGIYRDAGAGSTIGGSDVAQVRVESLFTHLAALRDALTGDDARGITLATSALETDLENLTRVRAAVGVRAQRVQQQKERSAEMSLTEQALLSDLQDADMTEIVVRYTQLQQQLEAALRVGAQNLQLSLLDFLR